MREKNLAEMVKAMVWGNLVTVIAIAALHTVFSPVEIVAFWAGTWLIGTYAAWSVIDWTDKKNSRNAETERYGKH